MVNATPESPDVPLFAGYEPPEPESTEELSAGQRLTRRQAANVAAGIHPLTRGRLHELASRHRDAKSPKNDPFTCGSCWFREVLRYHGKSYAKCMQGVENPTDQTKGRAPYVTHSEATDVRAWWPACPNYSPSDSLSTDAARYVPEVD